MYFYLALLVATLVIGTLGYLIWSKTGNLAFLVGIAIMYYWSLYGAWFIVIDGLGGNSGKNYHYLFNSLFPIRLDDNYLWTIILYSLFIAMTELTVLWLVWVDRPAADQHYEPLVISHGVVLVVVLISVGLSYVLLADQIASAAAGNRSAYIETRKVSNEANPYYNLHSLLTYLALIPLGIGMAVSVSGEQPRYIKGRGDQRFFFLVYIAVTIGVFSYLIYLGDRHQALLALLTGGLFYLANCARPRWLLMCGLGAVALSVIALIGELRGLSASQLLDGLSGKNAVDSLLTAESSNEAFSAHFSLYGVLKFEVPYTYGSSFLYFGSTFIPRFIWADRPIDIYTYYVNEVGALKGEEYTIHHAAGWYLNFGVLGIGCGAILLGWIWSTCFNRLSNLNGSQPQWVQTFTILAPFTFTSSFISLMRGGPEGYKSIILVSFLIPTVVFMLAGLGPERALRRRPPPPKLGQEPPGPVRPAGLAAAPVHGAAMPGDVGSLPK